MGGNHTIYSIISIKDDSGWIKGRLKKRLKQLFKIPLSHGEESPKTTILSLALSRINSRSSLRKSHANLPVLLVWPSVLYSVIKFSFELSITVPNKRNKVYQPVQQTGGIVLPSSSLLIIWWNGKDPLLSVCLINRLIRFALCTYYIYRYIYTCFCKPLACGLWCKIF